MPEDWRCPVCGGTGASDRFRIPPGRADDGIDPDAFRPSATGTGQPGGRVVGCHACGHGSRAVAPPAAAMAAAYAHAADPVSLREEPGQLATAHRALAEIERLVTPGLACDLGCWTGSFLVAARERGWNTVGIEPSAWASARARERGLDVRTTDLEGHGLAPGSARLVVLADVLEHLTAPASAVAMAATLLEAGGVLYATVPDAGSVTARLLGRHWWSVVPMHLQYFTRSSLRRLLKEGGFEVRVLHRHPKVFTARYYAERLAGQAPALAGAAVRLLERAGWANRLVAPDLRDRLAVVATRA